MSPQKVRNTSYEMLITNDVGSYSGTQKERLRVRFFPP